MPINNHDDSKFGGYFPMGLVVNDNGKPSKRRYIGDDCGTFVWVFSGGISRYRLCVFTNRAHALPTRKHAYLSYNSLMVLKRTVLCRTSYVCVCARGRQTVSESECVTEGVGEKETEKY